MEEPSSRRRGKPDWSPERNADKALGFLPRLTAEIGFAMTGLDDVSVEVLPGTPTTVAFSAEGKLVSLMVLPLDEDHARKLLGNPPISTPDLAIDQLWEEQREVPTPERLLLDLPAWKS